MNTLDQVLLLEQKVESAVEKIRQLQAENDALRSKCAELTNAISSKSEQLKSFESDKNLIENGIQKALDHLNTIEYSIMDKVDQAASTPTPPVETPVIAEPTANIPEPAEQVIPQTEHTENQNAAVELENKIEQEFNSTSFNVPNVFGAPIDFPITNSFDTMKPVDKSDETVEKVTAPEIDSPFGNDFGTTFDNDEIDENNPDNEMGFDFC